MKRRGSRTLVLLALAVLSVVGCALLSGRATARESERQMEEAFTQLELGLERGAVERRLSHAVGLNRCGIFDAYFFETLNPRWAYALLLEFEVQRGEARLAEMWRVADPSSVATHARRCDTSQSDEPDGATCCLRPLGAP